MTQVTVTGTSTKIVTSGNKDMLVIYNNDTQPIFLCFDGACDSVAGTNPLTTANGFPVAAGSFIALNNDSFRNVFRNEVWAISQSGSADVRIQGA